MTELQDREQVQPGERDVILALASELERIARELRKLALGDALVRRPKQLKTLPGGFLDELRENGREAAAYTLSQLSAVEVANVFAHLGGSRGDRRRNRAWLTERVLYMLYDFDSGHMIMRDRA